MNVPDRGLVPTVVESKMAYSDLGLNYIFESGGGYFTEDDDNSGKPSIQFISLRSDIRTFKKEVTERC